MTADQYSSFKQLFEQEKPGIDYHIAVEDRGTDVLIMAPHGGRIEPGTSEIACDIAGGDLVDPNRGSVPYTIEIVGTGHALSTLDDYRHIGTFLMHGGALVFHAFEVR